MKIINFNSPINRIKEKNKTCSKDGRKKKKQRLKSILWALLFNIKLKVPGNTIKQEKALKGIRTYIEETKAVIIFRSYNCTLWEPK